VLVELDPRYNVALAEDYLRTKRRLHPSGGLATTDMGRKLGVVPLFGRELQPHLTQHCLDRGLPQYQVAL